MKISIKTLFVRYKFQIIITFFLLSIESILLIFIPYSMGLALDSLVEKELEGLYVLGGVLLGILFFSTTRRLYDTRVYSTIYARLATLLIKEHKRKEVDESVIVMRSALVKELVDFFEYDLTKAFTSIVGVFGALFIIFYINVYVFLICIFSFLLVYLVYMLSQDKIYLTNQSLNKELENRLTVIQQRNSFMIPHFKRIAKNMIRLSDIESYNYIIIQLLIGVIITTSLFIGVESGLSTGVIFAMLTYVLNFSFEVLTLPVLFQQFIRLQEITNRINKESE